MKTYELTAWEHLALEEAVKVMVRGNQFHTEQGELLANWLHPAEVQERSGGLNDVIRDHRCCARPSGLSRVEVSCV